MEADEPSFSIPPTQAAGSTAFSVPHMQVVGGMSTGSTSAPVFYVSSVRGPRMFTGTYTAPASSNNFLFSASNRESGQTKDVPSAEIVSS